MSKQKKENRDSAVAYDYGHSGYLLKRQRGRRLKNGTDRRNLKFESRFCILKSEYFTYMKHENASMEERQTFAVKRIEFIKDVKIGTFYNTEIDYSCCFQFGDDKEALYFIADTVEAKKKWMSKLKRAAEKNNNATLKTYHSGAYGSLQPDEWSCCKCKGREQIGCISTANIPDSMEERLRERRLSPPEPIPRERGGTTDSALPETYGSTKTMEIRLEYSHEMVQSLRLSSDCVLNFNGKRLLTGKRNGVVLQWEVTQNGIKLASQSPLQSHPCFEVAGQINSIDVHEEYAAVGSAVVQLVKLTDFALNKRILVHKSMKSMKHSEKKRNILAFLGRTGKLATAQLHGNTIDIWDVSSHKTLITDPCATYQLSESDEIWSLSAATVGERALISVVCLKDGETTLRILQLESSGSSTYQIVHMYTSAPVDGSTPEITGHTFLLNGRTIALAQESELKLFDVTHNQATTSDTSIQHDNKINHSEDKISCLDHSNQLLGVGLENGTLTVYKCNFGMQPHLTQSYIVGNDLSSKSGSIVSISFLGLNQMWCVAHKNGVLNVWKESTQDHCTTEKISQKSALGMELYARGILTKPKVMKPKANEFMDIGCGISISLPQEVAENEIPIEVAFTPYGPCLADYKLLGIPDGMLVVSPILWVCAPQIKHFTEAAIIKLPHCFDCKSKKDSDLLTVLKADHDKISVDEAGQFIMDFKKIDAQFPPDEQYGIISDNHFCLYCNAIRPYSEEDLKSVNYCLSILKPPAFSILETQQIQCILHYDLDGCHKLIREQTPDGYELIQRRPLQFTAGRYKAKMKIHIDSIDAVSAGWRITLQSDDEILLENVNYYNYRNPEILGKCSKITPNKSLLYPHTYPPRFILEVSAREMKNSESMTMEFIGPERHIKITIQLLSQVQPRLHALFKAVERSDAPTQQKAIQCLKMLVKMPHTETEV